MADRTEYDALINHHPDNRRRCRVLSNKTQESRQSRDQESDM